MIAWALHHRLWVMLIAALTFVGSLVLQGLFEGSGFVPVSDPKYRRVCAADSRVRSAARHHAHEPAPRPRPEPGD